MRITKQSGNIEDYVYEDFVLVGERGGIEA